MSLLGQSHLTSFDSENKMRVKQYNSSGTQSTIKKKALADVKNTLYLKSAQQPSKNNVVKPSNYGGRLLFGAENECNSKTGKDKQNGPVKDETIAQSSKEMINDDMFMDICKCDEIQDNDIDMRFSNLKLTKSQIESYALNWENPVKVTAKDKRLISIEEDGPIEIDFNSSDALDLLLDMIPQVKIPQLEVPVPPLENDFIMNGSFDCSISL